METFPNFDRQVEGFMRVTLPSFRKRPINMPTGGPHFFACRQNRPWYNKGTKAVHICLNSLKLQEIQGFSPLVIFVVSAKLARNILSYDSMPTHARGDCHNIRQLSRPEWHGWLCQSSRYITLLLTHLAFHYILGIFTIAEEYVCHDENNT